VAEAVGWSEAHLKAAFRKETGQTPHEYFLQRKVDKARHLLTTGKRTVTEIAMTLGFSSSQHFATAFRNFTGQTPSDARARRRIKCHTFPTKAEAEFGITRAQKTQRQND
jgi:AraC-like DNA-binding protein